MCEGSEKGDFGHASSSLPWGDDKARFFGGGGGFSFGKLGEEVVVPPAWVGMYGWQAVLHFLDRNADGTMPVRVSALISVGMNVLRKPFRCMLSCL